MHATKSRGHATKKRSCVDACKGNIRGHDQERTHYIFLSFIFNNFSHPTGHLSVRMDARLGSVMTHGSVVGCVHDPVVLRLGHGVQLSWDGCTARDEMMHACTARSRTRVGHDARVSRGTRARPGRTHGSVVMHNSIGTDA